VEVGGLIAIMMHMAIILAVLSSPTVSLYASEGVHEYALEGSVLIYLEEAQPTVYLYISYSTGPGSLLVDLPLEPYSDNIEVVGGSAIEALYMGNLYSLVLVNSSQGSVILRYRGEYGYEGGARVLEVRNTSWISYIEVVVRKGIELAGMPSGAIQYSEGEHTRYRIYHMNESFVLYIILEDRAIALKLIGLTLSTSAAGIAATYYTLRIRRQRSSNLGRVDAIDGEILRAIRDLGGEARISEIQELTGLPKTTLWRRLRKLERIGYIEIYRAGKGSMARLKRPLRKH